MRSILLLDEDSSDARPSSDIGLLFNCPPDAPIKKNIPDAIDFKDLIGDVDYAKERAAKLARALLEDEPELRGISQLEVFEEVVIRELQQLYHAAWLFDFLIKKGYKKCKFRVPNWISRKLEDIIRITGECFVVEYQEINLQEHNPLNRIRRSWTRLHSESFNLDALYAEFDQIKRRLDPYFLRASFRMKKKYEKGKLWFYSTSNTFTNIGMLYEPFFPEQFLYLVENPLTGGVPLKSANREFISPYDFVRSSMAPKMQEIDGAKKIVSRHLAEVQLNDEDSFVRGVFLKGSWFAEFLNNLLPRGLFQTSLFEAFVNAVEPSAVVVGNPVFESYILQASRKRRIPTLLLQHGILGDFCQFIDPPVDHYIVRGRFWKDFLSLKAAERAEIINPKKTIFHKVRSEVRLKQKKIVFLTGPRLNKGGESDILKTILLTCSKMDIELVVRVHPRESIGYYKKLFVGLLPGQDLPKISYSQGDGLEELLGHSLAAVTYSSTVFLDCLRLSVPIISFGWYNFCYKKKIEQYGVFHFCQSLQELGSLIMRAAAGELAPYTLSIEPFLADSQDVEIHSRLSEMVTHN